MFKKIFIFLIVLIVLLEIVSAEVDISFLKDKYISEDTVQLEVDLGNLTLVEPLTYSNFKLYKDNTKIPLNINLYKLKDKYFVFFDLPNLNPGDYSFVLENVLYSDKNTLKKQSFPKNLTIIGGKGISINPGLIYLNVEEWQNPRVGIEIKNKADEDITLNFESGSQYILFNTQDYLLRAGKSFFLSIILDMKSYPEKNFDSYLEIKYLEDKYKIPVIINKIFNSILGEGGEVSEILEKGNIRFVEDTNKIERTLRKEDSLEGTLRFKNFGNKSLNNLIFLLTSDLSDIVRFEYFGDHVLDGNEEESVYVYVNEIKNINKNYTGDLIVKAEGLEAKFPFYIIYLLEENLTGSGDINKNETLPSFTPPSPPTSMEIGKEKKGKSIWIYVLFILFFLALVYIIYYFYKKGKPETEEFESLIPEFRKK